jgi:hypothetical protein
MHMHECTTYLFHVTVIAITYCIAGVIVKIIKIKIAVNSVVKIAGYIPSLAEFDHSMKRLQVNFFAIPEIHEPLRNSDMQFFKLETCAKY